MIDQAVQEATAGLGRQQAVYGTSTRRSGLQAFFGILLVLGALAAGYAYITADPKEPNREGALVVAVICAIIGVPLFIAWLTQRGKTIEVYEHGLVRIKGKNVKVTRWDDITAVWQQITRNYYNGIYTGTTYVYTILTKSGEKFKITNVYKDVESLGNTIQSEVTKRLLPPMVQAYQSGQTVNFGVLSLSPQGLSYKNKHLAWNEIKDLKIQQGYISVKKEGGRWFNWASVSAASVPNLFVFLSMVDGIVGIRSGG
ncbi:MAG TPA: DUF6585 family protein [Oceanobacillus sp.]|nr:DUF6585 family protein [Oceanobacillus sp.]